MTDEGITTKAWTTKEGQTRLGARIDKKYLHKLLRNCIYSRKKGRKYHYYVSKSESRFGAADKTYERIPADEVEAATVAQIKTVLASAESIASVCNFIKKNGAQVDEASAVMAMVKLGDVWEQLFPAERHRIVNLMIDRVDLVKL